MAFAWVGDLVRVNEVWGECTPVGGGGSTGGGLGCGCLAAWLFVFRLAVWLDGSPPAGLSDTPAVGPSFETPKEGKSVFANDWPCGLPAAIPINNAPPGRADRTSVCGSANAASMRLIPGSALLLGTIKARSGSAMEWQSKNGRDAMPHMLSAANETQAERSE
ncbi:MAG: hypothetical protein AAF404_01990 [Pseudomonadota bacterium]